MTPPTAAAARIKGPLVWLDLDQEALDDAYDQTKYASNRDQVNGRRLSLSALARAQIGEPQRVAYGPSEIEKLDIYRTLRANAPISVYIHGGAWRQGRAADFAYISEMFVRAGAHHVVLDFASIDDVNGDLMTLAGQVRRAVAWVYRNAASFGGDANRLHVCGHSSGGHLAACVVVTDWDKEFGLPKDVVKGALLSSGMYDLEPVRLSKRSQYVKFTDEIVEKLSALRRLDCIDCPLIVSHGTYETPEFMRQARDFVAALKAAGKDVTFIVGEGYNHFEMTETLANPYGLTGRAVLAQMKLPA